MLGPAAGRCAGGIWDRRHPSR